MSQFLIRHFGCDTKDLRYNALQWAHMGFDQCRQVFLCILVQVLKLVQHFLKKLSEWLHVCLVPMPEIEQSAAWHNVTQRTEAVSYTRTIIMWDNVVLCSKAVDDTLHACVHGSHPLWENPQLELSSAL